MIHSKEEFAKIWKKETVDLSQLDFFMYQLINKLDSELNGFFTEDKQKEEYSLQAHQISELVVQLVDNLQFFLDQICFGKGCSLGCPNKLDTPFTEMEDETRFDIIEKEFKGNPAACRNRADCYKHDIINYVIKDTIIDFYSHFSGIHFQEDNPAINKLADFIADSIIELTLAQGPQLLKEPYRKAVQFTT